MCFDFILESLSNSANLKTSSVPINIIFMKYLKTLHKSLFFFFMSFFISSCGDDTFPVVKNFDIKKYSGTWYEIVRSDNRFEKNCEGTEAIYTLNADKTVNVRNSCTLESGKRKTAKGIAKFRTKDETIGALKVSFFRPFYGHYNVVELADDYSYAMVLGGSKKYFWILSRTNTIDKKVMEKLLYKAKKLGVDTKSLIYTKQHVVSIYNDAEKIKKD